MKYCFILLYVSIFLFAAEKETRYYFYKNKVIKIDEYIKLNRKERKKVAYQFDTSWKVSIKKVDQSTIDVLILSGGLQVNINLKKSNRMFQGSAYFKSIAASCNEHFKLDKELKKRKIKFGRKRSYYGESKTAKGEILQVITCTFKDDHYYILFLINEKDLKLKSVQRALFRLKKSFKFLQ